MTHTPSQDQAETVTVALGWFLALRLLRKQAAAQVTA